MRKTFNGTIFALIAVVFTFAAIRLAQVIVAFWHGDRLQFFTFSLCVITGAFIVDVYYRLKNGKPK